ncbi:hypothetical protein ADP71_30850 [Vitreoscilla sp. C1]|uniref:hypothetical protein n=1 Tax=Vitreoscilla sp. (strain C1) TaxID=96942 RepID=UPI00148EC76A|nr:hypothetical protein [Vitreoscilla sp. C1]AUZ06272.2 hypothetical protein ADP71_30850 [Vitreoscilla sp. C1]
MKIIPFNASAPVSLFKAMSFEPQREEDMQTKVERLVFSLTAKNAVMFEEGGLVIQLDEGGWFLKPVHSYNWLYHPHLFEPTEFEIQNPKWNAKLQSLFKKHCMPALQMMGIGS